MFLKNRNIISKMKRSKVTDYAALKAKIIALRSSLWVDSVSIPAFYYSNYYVKTAFVCSQIILNGSLNVDGIKLTRVIVSQSLNIYALLNILEIYVLYKLRNMKLSDNTF